MEHMTTDNKKDLSATEKIFSNTLVIAASVAVLALLGATLFSRVFEAFIFQELEELSSESRVITWGMIFAGVVLVVASVFMLFQRQRLEKGRIEERVFEQTRELKEERARLVASINSIPFGFLLANKNGRVLLVNDVLTKLFALDDKKGVVIEDLAERFDKTFDLKLQVGECLKGNKVCEIKEIMLNTKYLRGIIAPILAGEELGGTIGYVLLFEDITETKSLERSRDEFFSIASHELRTPLTAIRGNTSMLLDMVAENFDADTRAMLSDVHEASVRLIGVVDDFLDVASLEQGRVTIEQKEIDLPALIEKKIRELAPSAESKGLTIRFGNSEPPSKAMGDAKGVEKVLANLLGNAIKFSPKGIITIDLSDDKATHMIKITIKDPGMGIPPERQTLLFHKFQQAGEEILARDVTQGTGLGLYISKLLIERMGGAIGLEKSVPGEGSTFYFTLPLAP